MRRTVIRNVLPILFCIIPILTALAIAVAIEPQAKRFYLKNLTWMDTIILSIGVTLFTLQMILSYKAMRWVKTGFDERPDPWLSHLAQAAEWFPLMGLLGTVAGILQTFSNIGPETSASSIIALYAPAITATGSGLFMALINIFPTWVVKVGRDLIQSLGGEDAVQQPNSEDGDTAGTDATRSSSRSAQPAQTSRK